ncbi:MAG: hypothetical protein IKS48_06680 [Eubacterium sp.]|nr:hypothetical protein [Eubacterium sp.]
MKLRERLIMGLCIASLLCVAGCGAVEDSDNVLGEKDSVTSESAQQEEKTVVKSVSVTTEKKTEATSENKSDKAIGKSKEEASSTEATNINASSFVGQWAEEHAHRGVISISEAGKGTYDVEVSWSGSAFEKAIWTMKAQYNNDTNRLEYSDCTNTFRTYSDEENYTDEVEYTDGSGYMYFADSKLGWVSSKSDVDGIDGSSFFVSYDSIENEQNKPAPKTSEVETKTTEVDIMPNEADNEEDVTTEDMDGERKPDSFVGTYTYEGTNAQSGELIVTRDEDAYYVTINVIVSEDKEEYSVTFSGKFSGKGVLTYDNAIKTHIFYDENHVADEIEDYNSGTGTIQLGYPDGDTLSMNWHDGVSGEESVFFRTK